MAEKRRILRRLHITNVDRTWKGRNGYSKAVLFKAVDADIDKAYHSARRSGAGRASGGADQRLERMKETHSAAHIAAMRRYIEQGLSFEEAHERALAEIGKAMGLKVGDWVQYTVPKPPEPPTRATGKVLQVATTGDVGVGGEEFEASPENPVARVQVYARTDAGFELTDRVVARPADQLRKIEEPEVVKAVSANVRETLSGKVEEHNEKYGGTAGKRVNVGMLSQVFERGIGAYKTNPGSVRPTVMSAEQWAFARVNGFLSAVGTGRYRRGKYDTDLLPEGHPLKSERAEKATPYRSTAEVAAEVEKATKREDGEDFPMRAFAYAPDAESPSTWKLRLWDSLEEEETAAQVGRAVAALGPGGFRGNRVEIPADDLPGVIRKVRSAWRKVNDADRELPQILKAVDDSHRPTAEMRSEARRGLQWREEFNRGGTMIGVSRARDILNGNLSTDSVRRMSSFFARHEVDKRATGFRPGEDGYPSAGRIAWALWGGDAGQTWSKTILSRMEKAHPTEVREPTTGADVMSIDMEALDPSVREHIEALEAELAGVDKAEVAEEALAAAVEKALSELSAEQIVERFEGVELAEVEEPQVDTEDLIKGLPEEVRAEIAKGREALEKAERLEQAEQKRHFADIAKGMPNLSEKQDDVAAGLHTIAKAVGEESDAFKLIHRLLKAADAQAEEAMKALGKAVGHGEEGRIVSDKDGALEEINQIASEMVSKGLAPTVQQAKLAMRDTHPQLIAKALG